MNPQHRLASFDVGLVDQDLTIEAAWTEQGRVEHFGPVGCGHDDDRLARIEAVHFRQQLIERLFALFVTAERALRARLTQRVELVDEHHARRFGFGLLEQIAHARGADADEHLDEFRTAQAEEGHMSLAGNRTSQQRLTGARWADEQHALGNLAAQRRVLASGS